MNNPEIITLEWYEVRDCFLDKVNKGKWPKGQPMIEDGSWSGGTFEQTADWIKEGYRSSLFEVHDPVPNPAKHNRPKWNDEFGEPDGSRLLGGADEFYLERAETLTRPGMTLNIGGFFAAGVGAKFIAEYGAWCASLIDSLETQGYDLEVTIDVRIQGLYRREQGNQIVRIIVKRPNEVSDFASWSVLFAPTGLRHLLFTAMVLACDKIGKRCTSHFATSLNNPWGLTVKDGVITIENAQRNTYNRRQFSNKQPLEILTQLAKENNLV